MLIRCTRASRPRARNHRTARKPAAPAASTASAPSAAGPARPGSITSGIATMHTVSASATCTIVATTGALRSPDSSIAGITSAAELDAISTA
ncbi:hypothetical protein FNH05_34485 [Amycolatopsis rhizosphaerae]|uniref:Uncharacterized protein n=1 Tax=Amycolatopsis rhizosphaerae TaxID=2053003 RepID=A0A558A863_9PSEU|nr:hypothetical protein [Amycolatopsis rhizosphaerae]TVT20441.1 hypothetical protein FNH05_34485 [Amycolatopsis rhizosphaerae]